MEALRAICHLNPCYLEFNQHQQTLENLISCLVQSPILAYPDYNQPFILHTDASADGLGSLSTLKGYHACYWLWIQHFDFGGERLPFTRWQTRVPGPKVGNLRTIS